MTEKSPASAAHNEQQTLSVAAGGGDASAEVAAAPGSPAVHATQRADSQPDGQAQTQGGDTRVLVLQCFVHHQANVRRTTTD